MKSFYPVCVEVAVTRSVQLASSTQSLHDRGLGEDNHLAKSITAGNSLPSHQEVLHVLLAVSLLEDMH